MAQQNIYLGAVAEDGTGDSPRVAGDKINDNFTELYNTQTDLSNANSALILAIKAMLYPVGCIYTTIDPTNPNTTFGFGTWVAFGSGRTLVGVDAGQSEFDTVEETGGAKTVAHIHTYSDTTSNVNSITVGYYLGGGNSILATATHNHTYSGITSGASDTNNLQPYITVYFWKRTA